jgi:hypothetical protein
MTKYYVEALNTVCDCCGNMPAGIFNTREEAEEYIRKTAVNTHGYIISEDNSET